MLWQCQCVCWSSTVYRRWRRDVWTGVWALACRGATYRLPHRLCCQVHVSFFSLPGGFRLSFQTSHGWKKINVVVFCRMTLKPLGLIVWRQKTEMVRSPMIPLAMPQKLRFNITPEVKRDIEKAKQNMNMYVTSCQTFAIFAVCARTSFHSFLCCVSEWSKTWMSRSWCSAISGKMYQSSTSWAQTVLFKRRCSLPTIGENSLLF